jgi:hypothetical protein
MKLRNDLLRVSQRLSLGLSATLASVILISACGGGGETTASGGANPVSNTDSSTGSSLPTQNTQNNAAADNGADCSLVGTAQTRAGFSVQTQQKTYLSGGNSITTNNTVTTEANASFRGVTGLLAMKTVGAVVTTTVPLLMAQGTDEIRSYGQVNGDKWIDQGTEVVGFSRSYYDPALSWPMNPQVGGSSTQSYTYVLEANGLPVTRNKQTQTYKILGLEQVSVPAGAFTACKSEITISDDSGAPATVSRQWTIASGPWKGITVRSEMKGVLASELLSIK